MANNPSGPLGHAKSPLHVQVRESRLTWMTPIFTLVISGIALVVSLAALWFTWSPWGEVRAIEPSSYAIIRQDALGSRVISTSEHLVLPMEWENDRGTPVLIKGLELTVSEVEGDGGTQKFYLVKEYPALSGAAFKNKYDFRNSLTLEPDSVSTRVLSFRSEDRQFEFKPSTEYEVSFELLRHQVPLSGLLQTGRPISQEIPAPHQPKWQFCTYDSSAMIHTGDVEWNWWGSFDEAHNGRC